MDFKSDVFTKAMLGKFNVTPDVFCGTCTEVHPEIVEIPVLDDQETDIYDLQDRLYSMGFGLDEIELIMDDKDEIQKHFDGLTWVQKTVQVEGPKAFDGTIEEALAAGWELTDRGLACTVCKDSKDSSVVGGAGEFNQNESDMSKEMSTEMGSDVNLVEFMKGPNWSPDGYDNFVTPKVYWIGATEVNFDNLKEYLKDTGNEEFLKDIEQAQKEKLSSGEILISFYAKLCYASLSLGHNQNISKVRSIHDNVLGVISSHHLSCIEHVNLNFVVHNCSRVYSHEQTRHRVGTAYSQTSGRYVRSEVLDVVIDPILEPAYDLVEEARLYLQDWYKRIQSRFDINNIKDFDKKKKLTSAFRRMLPNGQANEMGMSLNLRTLRHTIEMRTSRHSEAEIRLIYNQIADLVKKSYPAIFADAKFVIIDDQYEITFGNKSL